jgi:hypothetical protein
MEIPKLMGCALFRINYENGLVGLFATKDVLGGGIT